MNPGSILIFVYGHRVDASEEVLDGSQTVLAGCVQWQSECLGSFYKKWLLGCECVTEQHDVCIFHRARDPYVGMQAVRSSLDVALADSLDVESDAGILRQCLLYTSDA